LPQGPAPVMHPFRHSRWAPCSPPAPRGGARTCGLLLRRPLRSGTDRTAGTVPPTAAAMDDQQQPRAGARCYCFVWIARVRVTRQPLPECRESAVRGRETYPCFCRREGLRRERSGDPVRAETETVACRGSTRPRRISGTHRHECLNPTGIPAYLPTSAIDSPLAAATKGPANLALLARDSAAERLDRTQEVGGSSPPSSIARIAQLRGSFVLRCVCLPAEFHHVLDYPVGA